jgi:predicted protein tyrosine phosphatase
LNGAVVTLHAATHRTIQFAALHHALDYRSEMHRVKPCVVHCIITIQLSASIAYGGLTQLNPDCPLAIFREFGAS